MQIVNKLIKELKPYEKNPRKNNEAVEYVANSIKEFGFKVPIIIDKDDVIVAGHTRYKAAKRLKMKEVPCIVADDLTEEQIKAFRIADNKVGEIAQWDDELLTEELSNIFNLDMSDFGFEDVFGESLIEEIKEVDIPEAPEIPKSKYGDIYQLGNHRLMCGDSTKEEDVKKLMNGKLANIIVTDPPYNVDYEGTVGKIKNDNMKDDDFYQFLLKAFTNMNKVLKDGGSFYVWFASRESVNFYVSLEKSGFIVKQELIWNKNSLVMGRADYQWKHEPCLYGWKDGASHHWYGDRKQTTVIDWDKPVFNDLHPTMKPVGLFDYQIKNSSKKGDIVLDLFGGSGTTIIACEQDNRTCYMMELDPKYVDVIIKRWEDLTGEKAVLIKR